MNRTLRNVIIGIFIAGLIIAWNLYKTFIDAVAVPENIESPFINIPTGSSFDEVVDLLKEKKFISDENSFRRLATYMKYERPTMRAGRYQVKPGWTNIQLIRHLRGGAQSPVKVILTNERLTEEVAKKVARFIEPSADEMQALFNNEKFLSEIGYTKETLMSLFIPNTYELFWNTTPEAFMDRMVMEHKRFWSNNNRKKAAKSKEMTPEEVYTLASIVERETLNADEKPRMAGVYLNRIQKGIKLQADPTAVFATRDFDTPRVLNRHINFDSPYNTYKYKGLPPGPISMASISSIDAVLKAENHDYIFFCARGDGSGYHNFAKTLAGHGKNRAIYVRNLKKRGLR